MMGVIRRIRGIAANLVLHLKKGYGSEFAYYSPTQIASLETAFRFLGVSARRFRESLMFLRLALCWFGYWLKNCAIAFLCQHREQISVVQRSQGRTPHSLKTHSCPLENTQKQGLSNAEKVDAPITSCDDGDQWQKSSKPLSSPLHSVGDGGQL
jgi:hypothetical protein